jgi:hypothetical protein
MKKLIALLAALFIGVATFAPVAAAEDNDNSKVVICHKGTSMEVPREALRGHLGHGDSLGACKHDDEGDGDGHNGDGKPKPPPVKPPVPTPVPLAAPKFSGPAPIIQAYGLAEDPTCQLTPAWAKFSNVADGGWGKSWGPWLNGGKGGEACVRYIVYKNSTKTWVPSGSL